MIRRELDEVQKEGRILNSNVSTVMNGLMAMNGTIRSLNRGILFLNMKLTFYAMRIALWRYLKSIKMNTWGHEQGGSEEEKA